MNMGNANAIVILLILGVAAVSAVQLRVGTKIATPFSFKEDGKWTGFSFEMLDYFIQQNWLTLNNVTVTNYTVIEKPGNPEGFQGIQNDEYDLFLAAPTKTAEREKLIDFSHSFFHTGFGLMVPNTVPSIDGTIAWFNSIFTQRRIFYICMGVSFLTAIGSIVWTIEVTLVKEDDKYFNTGLKGLWQGIVWTWNSIISDSYSKKPRHGISQKIGWGLGYMTILLTALVTATLTAATLDSPIPSTINSKADLPGHKTAIVPGTTAANWVKSQGNIPTKSYQTMAKAFAGVAAKEVEAFVYDAPMIFWYIKQQEAEKKSDVKAVGETFEPQDYGLVTNDRIPDLEETVNIAVLEYQGTTAYEKTYDKWFKVKPSTTTILIDFEWSVTNMIILGCCFLVPLVVSISIVTVYVRKLNKRIKDRLSIREQRLENLGELSNADLGRVLSQIAENQAQLMLTLYKLHHSEDYFNGSPVGRGDVDAFCQRIRQMDQEFLSENQTKTEPMITRTPGGPSGPPSTTASFGKLSAIKNPSLEKKKPSDADWNRTPTNADDLLQELEEGKNAKSSSRSKPSLKPQTSHDDVDQMLAALEGSGSDEDIEEIHM